MFKDNKNPDDVSAPEATLNRLIAMVDDLVKVMQQEEDLIEARNMKEHGEVLKTKQLLTIAYRNELKSIALQPDMLKSLSADKRSAAKDAARKLSDVSERNARFLRGAVMASERLAMTVMQAVKDQALPKQGYGNPMIKANAYSPITQSVAVNRTA
jgi:hypothetical protein